MDLTTTNPELGTKSKTKKVKGKKIKLIIKEDNQITNEVIENNKLTDIYNYLNKSKLNETLSEEDFIKMLPSLVDNLLQHGFNKIVNDYNHQYLSDIASDWAKLKSCTIETNNINAQSTIGLSIIKKYMPHLYDVKNYKGKSISLLWT